MASDCFNKKLILSPVAFLLVGCVTGALSVGVWDYVKKGTRSAEINQATKLMISGLAREVERFYTQNGRNPIDQNELEVWLKAPLPRSYRGNKLTYNAYNGVWQVSVFGEEWETIYYISSDNKDKEVRVGRF